MISKAERGKRIKARLDEERTEGRLRWWWLSFCDGSQAKGSQFLGACLVQAMGMGDAVAVAHAVGINPGGEVLGLEAAEGLNPPERFCGRLLSRQECEAFERESSASKTA